MTNFWQKNNFKNAILLYKKNKEYRKTHKNHFTFFPNVFIIVLVATRKKSKMHNKKALANLSNNKHGDGKRA